MTSACLIHDRALRRNKRNLHETPARLNFTIPHNTCSTTPYLSTYTIANLETETSQGPSKKDSVAEENVVGAPCISDYAPPGTWAHGSVRQERSEPSIAAVSHGTFCSIDKAFPTSRSCRRIGGRHSSLCAFRVSEPTGFLFSTNRQNTKRLDMTGVKESPES